MRIKRSGRLVRSAVPLIRKRHKFSDAFQKAFAHPPCRLWAVARDVFPNFRDLLRRFGMENKTWLADHGVRDFRSFSSRCRRLSKNASPSMGLTVPLFRSL